MSGKLIFFEKKQLVEFINYYLISIFKDNYLSEENLLKEPTVLKKLNLILFIIKITFEKYFF